MEYQPVSHNVNSAIRSSGLGSNESMAINAIKEEMKTILVVDDDEHDILILKSILDQQYNIVIATSGIRALLIADALPIDMILLDVHMPGMDGYDLCHHLKSGVKTSQIPIMFVTGSSEAADEVRVFAMGAVDYVTKPVNPHTLIARIKTHIALSDATIQLKHHTMIVDAMSVLREQVEQITRHDLKAPLNTIIVAPQVLLLDCCLTTRQRELISHIMECGYRMLDMINNSLDVFKIENNTYQLKPMEINIVKVLDDVFRDLSSVVNNKQIIVDIILAPEGGKEQRSAMAYAEYLLCYTLFSNLISNALEASPQNTFVTITVTRNTQITTTIENYGEVPDHIRPTFFNKFVTSGKQYGTGLGTYSAMLFAKAQHGDIVLDTTIAGKTRISVILPAFKNE